MKTTIELKEAPTYKLQTEHNRCPHCDKALPVPIHVDKMYQTPKDLKWFEEHGEGHAWHEDITCPQCKQPFSRSNGC